MSASSVPIDAASFSMSKVAYCLVPLEKYNSPAFVSSRKVIACVVEFDG